jgi:uncharacterized protein UPF0182
LVDLLWFSTLGYRQVFIITLGAQVAIVAIVWVVAFLAIWISGMIALRLSRERGRLHLLGRSDEMVQVNLPELIRAFGDRAVEIIRAGERRDPFAVCGAGRSRELERLLEGASRRAVRS